MAYIQPCPERDIPSSDGISRASEPATDTEELALSTSVGLVNTTAYGTRSGGIAWVNQQHANTSQLGLVLDEGPQLVERPGVVGTTLRPFYRCPFAYARQVLKGNPARGVKSFRNHPLADNVVYMPSKARLLAPSLLQQALGRLRTLSLQFGTEPGVSGADTVERGPTIHVAVTVRGDIDDAQVHAKPAVRINGRSFGNVYHDTQVEHAVTEDKVSLPAYSPEPLGLVLTHDDGNKQATRQGEDTYAVKSLPREDTLVVDNRAVLAELDALGLVSLVRLSHLAHNANGHLRRQAKAFAQGLVDELLQGKLVSRLLLKGNIGHVVTRLVETLHCGKQRDVLLWCGREFDYQRCVHALIIEQFHHHVKHWAKAAKAGRFLPGLKPLGFRA